MNQIAALVWKDLQIHRTSIAVYLLGCPILLRVLLQTQHTMGLTRGQSLVSMVVPTAISFSSMFAIFIAQWLIERERGKSTFAWIRTLPLSDTHIVLAKFAAVLVFCLAGGAGWRISVLGIDLATAPWQLLSAWLLWWTLAGLALFCQVMFSGRLAGLVPGVLAFALAGVAVHITRSPAAVARAIQIWNDPRAHFGLWLMCAAMQATVIGATYRLFSSRDSHSLVE